MRIDLQPARRHDRGRRRFLRGLAGFATGSLIGPAVAGQSGGAVAGAAASDRLDEALERIARRAPEYAGVLSNHAPMAAEALTRLGRPDLVLDWVRRYEESRDLPPAPVPASRIGKGWRQALGDGRRMADWIAFFDERLEEASWTEVVATWPARLAPGLLGAATHGIIRTAHAVRSLEARETAPRRHELAQGLGYWAARYQSLPGSTPEGSPGVLPSRALRSVRPDRGLREAPASSIVARLKLLQGFEPFEPVLGLVDPTGDGSAFLSDLSLTFADVYLTNATTFGAVIGLIHAITGPASVRLLLPHVGTAARADLLRHAWQAAAALYVIAAQRPPDPPAVGEPPPAEELTERAVRKGAHGIKFTEACLREHAVNPRPSYLLAAHHALGMLGDL